MNPLARRSLLALATFALPVHAATLLAPSRAQACGGLFCDSLPVEQNAERILFEIGGDGTLTTTVEITYTGEPEGFSWVVPIAETPTLGIVPPSTLRLLDGVTVPTIMFPPTKCEGSGSGAFSGDDDDATDDDDSAAGDVDVEDLPQVGPFDPEVVSSDDPGALVTWLNDNGYLITPAMEPFVAGYVASGMKFLAMKLAPGAGTADITPIAMTTTGGDPMVPISLTSVAAEPEMGVIVFIAGAGRYASENYANLRVDPADVQADPRNRQTNYYPLLSWMVDEAGGRAFVTEYVDRTSRLTGPLNNFFLGTSDAEEAQAHVRAVLDRTDTLTRLATRISGWEMSFDPVFVRASDDAVVPRRIDLSDRPAVEVCGPAVTTTPPCGLMYCGVGAQCATTDAGSDGCVCPEGFTARAVREQGDPGFFLRDTIVCQDNGLEFFADVLGTEEGPADPCDTASCGEFGACVAVNGFPTCACDGGYAAVPNGIGGAVCAAVRELYGPDQLLGRVAGCGACSTAEAPDLSGGPGLALCALALSMIARRRRG